MAAFQRVSILVDGVVLLRRRQNDYAQMTRRLPRPTPSLYFLATYRADEHLRRSQARGDYCRCDYRAFSASRQQRLFVVARFISLSQSWRHGEDGRHYFDVEFHVADT